MTGVRCARVNQFGFYAPTGISRKFFLTVSTCDFTPRRNHYGSAESAVRSADDICAVSWDHRRLDLTVSILSHPIWPRIANHLKVTEYDRDGGHDEPRHRIEFLSLPEALGREAAFVQMPCVCCKRPVNPLRRREGDGWDRLYYAPCCALGVRIACSRGAEARDEYEKFIAGDRRTEKQLSLF